MIRSDAGVAHRLSLSARVLSAVDSQVKAKRQRKKCLWHLHNRHARAVSTRAGIRHRVAGDGNESPRARATPSSRPPGMQSAARSAGPKYYPGNIGVPALNAAMPAAGFFGVAAESQRRSRSRRLAQTLISELPAGLHSVTERFSRADVDQHIDHRRAARPTIAPMKLASDGAGIDRHDVRTRRTARR